MGQVRWVGCCCLGYHSSPAPGPLLSLADYVHQSVSIPLLTFDPDPLHFRLLIHLSLCVPRWSLIRQLRSRGSLVSHTLHSFVDLRITPQSRLTLGFRCDERVDSPQTTLWVQAGCCRRARVVHIFALMIRHPICPYSSLPLFFRSFPDNKIYPGRSDRVLIRSSCPPRVTQCVSESLVV